MDYANMTTTELFAVISKLEASKREMVKALKQAADCIEDLG